MPEIDRKEIEISEKQIETGRTKDARMALREMRAKYDLYIN